MRNYHVFIILSLILVSMSGCNKDDPSIDNHPKEQLDHSQLNEEPELEEFDSGVKSTGFIKDKKTIKEKADELSFHALHLKTTYGAGEYFHLQYDHTNPNGEVFAIIKESLSGSYLKGTDAFMAIYTLFQDVDLNKNLSEDAFIKEILTILKLDNNFSTISLEITLKNGDTIQINR